MLALEQKNGFGRNKTHKCLRVAVEDLEVHWRKGSSLQ